MQQGTVKWFEPVKGYGFINGDDGQDFFVHQSDIRMKGFRFLKVGQRVKLMGLSINLQRAIFLMIFLGCW